MILRVKSVARQSFVSISSLLLISRIISEKRRERQELRERGIISTLVTDGERWEDGGRQDTARVGRIRSDRDWITCSCLPAIVCSMPITNMPALNFQLVSLNCANTAAPVPASRVAERFLFSRYIASLSLSLSLSSTVFSFRYRTVKQLVETGNCAVPPSASTEPPVFLPFPRQKFFASYTQSVC